ncbi:hypothetical protein EMCRGX_G002762 [Ephydatia muelleri]
MGGQLWAYPEGPPLNTYGYPNPGASTLKWRHTAKAAGLYGTMARTPFAQQWFHCRQYLYQTEILSSSGIYRILIIMELETDKTYAHVMGLSAEVLHLYLNQANLTTSGNKKALVERMLDNAIIRSNAPSKGESGKNPAGQDGTQNEDEPAGQALQSIMDLDSPA